MSDYCIAGLKVRMDTFGRTAEQAALYVCPVCDTPDILIQSEPERVKAAYPRLSDEECEYLASGASFYRQLLDFDGMMLHSSAVVMDGRAYLFTANSGTGKSTHTRLWRQVFGDRAVMVNDDKPFLKLTETGVLACGSPWSGKHGLDTNITVPLQGICILERGKENQIHRISSEEALPMLLHQSYCPLAPEKRTRFEEQVRFLAETVPLWHMYCNMDPSAAEVSHQAMSK